ncbi:hypothetical protein DFS34DRAFT_592658 [Phlyctochytrium arcticum]|nr:hypothetical protein DFS34DRAFT_592658 [Phlyctochytrium arcticum]
MGGSWRSILAGCLLLVGSVRADEHSHVYAPKEEVVLWMNSVGPYDNLQETYEFLSLPFCRGNAEVHHHHESLGEALMGVQLVNAGLNIEFGVNKKTTTMCTKELNADEINIFRYAISKKYWLQMFLDDLPQWEFIGAWDNDIMHLYTHRDIAISYNGDQIVEFSSTPGNKIALPNDVDSASTLSVKFTYSVTFKESEVPFAQRFNRYLDQEFSEYRIHWLSILNSFLMVLFLAGLVAIILYRTLRRDYARYDKEEGLLDLDRDLGDEYGWKLVHGDVFRSPTRLSVLSACVGTGIQLFGLGMCLILYTIAADLYLERSTMLTAAIFIYALTSTLSGYVSGSFFDKYGGKRWVQTMLLTATLWPGSVCALAIIVNFAAISIISTRAISFGTMVAIAAIWIFVIFPLTLMGYIVGRNFTKTREFPCRVNPIPRPIPDKVWYVEPLTLVAIAGLFPFGSIFIEIYFIFQSFWSVKIYYVYGFLLLVFVMLVVVTACVSTVATYLLLNAEDHRWHWTSFMSGGFTAVYVFLYSIYYFVFRTRFAFTFSAICGTHVSNFSTFRMYGYFQTTWYFGYTALICFGLFIMLGTVGHLAAERFVRRIYRNVKID